MTSLNELEQKREELILEIGRLDGERAAIKAQMRELARTLEGVDRQILEIKIPQADPTLSQGIGQ